MRNIWLVSIPDTFEDTTIATISERKVAKNASRLWSQRRKRIEELGSTVRQWMLERGSPRQQRSDITLHGPVYDQWLRRWPKKRPFASAVYRRTAFIRRISYLPFNTRVPLSASPSSKTLYRVARIFRFRSFAPIPNGSPPINKMPYTRGSLVKEIQKDPNDISRDMDLVTWTVKIE